VTTPSATWRRVTVVMVIAAFLAAGDHPFPPPGPPRDAPRVVVAMGDSTMAGEGAGSYEPGTDGEHGNWCHRSTRASVHLLDIPGVDGAINLACSGAPSAQVGLGPVRQYTEPSQASRLASIAATNRVVAVVVATGANDDPAFSHTLNACIHGWANRSRPACHTSIGPDWRYRVDAMAPKITRALHDVRTVMRDAGYRDRDYQLVLQSYAAPVGPGIADDLRDLSGCPFRLEDLRWIRDVAAPAMTAAMRRAADDARARFLDLSRAGFGHEACSAGDAHGREWFARLTIRWPDLSDERRATHAAQESFHPNAAGHAAFSRCLGEFLTRTDRVAACLTGQDGTLHAATGVAVD
jgi:hypothetical protein